MIIYRDYGAASSPGHPETAVYPYNLANYIKRTQVWQATHDGAGASLPHRYRSFISFSFGGKWIEDFELIATSKSDGLSRRGYADFEDLVTSYNIMDGLYYHGTHYKPNTISFDLATDEIDLKLLDEFLHWFAGGKTRELILAEHPNRAIMARVSSAPQLNLMPFEKPITLVMSGLEYTTSTTLYRGTISLELTSDMPFWYAKLNIFEANVKTNKGIFSGITLSPGIDLFKEAIKIVYEDTVPFNSMVCSNMHFGGDKYINLVENVVYTQTARLFDASNPTVKPENWDTLALEPGYYTVETSTAGVYEYWIGARTEVGSNIMGRVAGAVMTSESTDLTGPIPKNSTMYLVFYGGTAPSPVTISFKIMPRVNGNGYINCIACDLCPVGGKTYSTITLTSVHTKKFDFTTPNVITSWNKANKMFRSIKDNTLDEGTNWKDLADDLRDYIRHPAVRTFAVAIINYLLSSNTNNANLDNNGIFTSAGKTKALTLLLKFFKNRTGELFAPMEFSFNSETGAAIGKFKYWQAESSNTNIINILDGTPTEELETANFVEHTEDVGDMLRSNWLYIEDHNTFVNGTEVHEWTKNSPTNAHKVTHNLPVDLHDLKFEYKNMYL